MMVPRKDEGSNVDLTAVTKHLLSKRSRRRKTKKIPTKKHVLYKKTYHMVTMFDLTAVTKPLLLL